MNLRKTVQVLLILAIPYSLFSQEDLKIKRKDFRTDSKVGLNEAWANLLEGEKYYINGRGTYNLARKYYLLAYQYNDNHPVLNYKLGICYLYTDDKFEALQYMRKAYDQAPRLSQDMNFHLAWAYHIALEFDKAMHYYREYKNGLSKTALTEKAELIDKLINECIDGKRIVENPKRVIIVNMDSAINSPYDDYSPVFYNNGSDLYFTSRRPLSKRSKRNPYDNKFYENIFHSKLVDGEWQAATLVKNLSGKKKNDAVLGVSPDGTELYVYRGERNGGDIYLSTLKKGEWKKPKPLSKRINSKEYEGSVFLTAGNDSMFYVSASSDLSHGGRDILITTKNPKGKWNKPVNFGSLINTKYDESGPFLSPDGNSFYFSSKGHNTMGGYDIFYSVKGADGIWSDPENIGYPINTPDDDILFSLSPDGKFGYYSTIREGGLGARDIYKIIFLGSEKDFLLSTEDIPLAGTIFPDKKGFFSLPAKVEVDSFYYLTGKVLDKKTGDPVVAKLEFIDVEASRVVATALTDTIGSFRVKFQSAKTYGVEIKARDYLFFLASVDLSDASADEPLLMDFLIEKVEVGTKVVLENIYFETAKATLTSPSFVQLNQVVDFLQNSPTVKLEISGHTDNIGSAKANTKLSEDRAKAVVDYFVGRGIDTGRLEWKGYGFTQPIAPNDTPAGREQNRRVEFKVIDM